jgi:hypothetical protein
MQIDYSVAQALMQHSVGTVATAIEQHSCYHGRDRFGRLKLLQENEQEKVFKLLENYHIQEKFWYFQNESSTAEGESPSDIFDCNFELPHWHFGWPKNNIPEILKKIDKIQNSEEGNNLEISKEPSEIRSGAKKFPDNFESRDEIYAKNKYTHLAVIGALIKQCKLSIDESATVKKIAIMVTQNTGWPINEKTVQNILKAIPDAIERKNK